MAAILNTIAPYVYIQSLCNVLLGNVTSFVKFLEVWCLID